MLVDVHFFFFNDTATTEIYTLSLHDALPISSAGTSSVANRPTPPPSSVRNRRLRPIRTGGHRSVGPVHVGLNAVFLDRKSTRLNSSHANISYAVFCLKKKKYMSESNITRLTC